MVMKAEKKKAARFPVRRVPVEKLSRAEFARLKSMAESSRAGPLLKPAQVPYGTVPRRYHKQLTILRRQANNGRVNVSPSPKKRKKRRARLMDVSAYKLRFVNWANKYAMHDLPQCKTDASARKAAKKFVAGERKLFPHKKHIRGLYVIKVILL